MNTVTCSGCRAENPAGQKFCGECGSPLVAMAPPLPAPAGTTSPVGVTLPEGTALRTSAPPPEQERRLVTILFADLAGSTSLGHSLDPDDLYELLDLVHGRVEDCVLSYGGHVARHLGDGLMALFGAPIAHEDDAERAVLAGLAMQRALKELVAAGGEHSRSLEMRVGITSGEVVAGAMAGIYDVIGDAPNVAARLEGAARGGEVLVGEETMRLARRRIRFGERQELSLKGKPEPVAAYAAVGVRAQLSERWEGETAPGGYATPLIGRGRELAVVLAAWERVQQGEGQLLSLVGEPGVGKSRLLAETLDRIAVDGAAQVLRGRCLSYGQSVSLWLIADLLRSLCSVGEEEGLDTIRVRIASMVEAILASCDAEDRAIAIDVVGEVLGLPPADSLVARARPQVRRQSLVRILRLLLGSLVEQQAVILVLEDLHWLDSASQEILTELLADVPGMRVLVLAAQRPGWTAPRSEWGWTEWLMIRPLPDNEAAILAGAVLGGMSLSGQLEEHIRERAGGNPFFVEELLRFLDESGGLDERNGQIDLAPGRAEKLPSTLTEVLLARLDRLEQEVKGVAQVGSVIGRSFAVRLLARVMEREEETLDGPLRSLQQAEIAFPRRSPDPEYLFKHVTLRDVAYSMLVRRRQRQLHLQTARAIAALYPTDEYVEMIAYHYARTEEDAEAAEWLERAGDRAEANYATEAAIEHYRGALERQERCRAETGRSANIELKLGQLLNRATHYEEAEDAVERAIGRYREEGELEGAGRATASLGGILYHRGKLEDARRRLEEMAELAELLAEVGPSVAAAQLQEALTTVLQFQGRYGEMLAAAERAVTLARAVGDDGRRGMAQDGQGLALMFFGRMEEARRVLEEGVRLLEGAGDLVNLAGAITSLGENRRLVGRLTEAMQLHKQVLELTIRTGHVRFELLSHLNLAQLLVPTGEWKQAREHVARAEQIAALRGTAAWVAPFLPYQQGELALRQGDWAEAHQLLDQAVELAAGANRQLMEMARALLAELAILEGEAGEARDRLAGLVEREGADLPLLLPILAWAHLELGETERALELAARAEREARERQALLYLPETLRTKGMALARLGRIEEATTVLNEGRARAAAMPNPHTQARILVELGLLDRQEGKGDQARERLQEALTIFQRLGAIKDIDRMEQTLAELDQ